MNRTKTIPTNDCCLWIYGNRALQDVWKNSISVGNSTDWCLWVVKPNSEISWISILSVFFWTKLYVYMWGVVTSKLVLCCRCGSLWSCILITHVIQSNIPCCVTKFVLQGESDKTACELLGPSSVNFGITYSD